MSKAKFPDLTEFEAETGGRTKRIDQILDQLTPEQQDQVQAALRQPHITTSAIQRVLKRWGHEISYAALSNYRRSLR